MNAATYFKSSSQHSRNSMWIECLINSFHCGERLHGHTAHAFVSAARHSSIFPNLFRIFNTNRGWHFVRERDFKKSNLSFVWHFEIVTLFTVFWCLFDGKGSGETFWERCSCILYVFMYFKYPATRRGPTSIMCFRKSGWLVYLKCKCAQRKEI